MDVPRAVALIPLLIQPSLFLFPAAGGAPIILQEVYLVAEDL